MVKFGEAHWGATVRMAMATASCAVTAALIGAGDCCDLAVDIISWGSLTTRLAPLE